jgi:hypothetical protein
MPVFSGSSPFKRQYSLRLDQLPSTLERQQQGSSGFATSQPSPASNEQKICDSDRTSSQSSTGLFNPQLGPVVCFHSELFTGGGTVSWRFCYTARYFNRLLIKLYTVIQRCGSGMFYPGSGSDHCSLPDPDRGSGGKKHRIPDTDPQHCGNL